MNPPQAASAFWRQHARRYDRAIEVLNRRFPEMVAMVVEDVRGSARILEVAAGTGLVSVELASVAGELTATDASPAMLDVLRGRLAAEGHPEVKVQTADVLSLSFPDGSFDAVVVANLLHLLPDPAAALAELRRVLRPGGRLCAPTFATARPSQRTSCRACCGWYASPW
jgi:phosphatidylethanolamine/phosphatidyl-N-methylethanolamine N-methyltransferase